MKGEHYSFEWTPDKELFAFESVGPNGVFQKVVWFSPIEGRENVYNLALCVFQNGIMEDDILTQNDDFAKTMYTVAKAVHSFFETYPRATVQIQALGEKRLRIYNWIFQRKQLELESVFKITGVVNGGSQRFEREKFYEAFEISLKRK